MRMKGYYRKQRFSSLTVDPLCRMWLMYVNDENSVNGWITEIQPNEMKRGDYAQSQSWEMFPNQTIPDTWVGGWLGLCSDCRWPCWWYCQLRRLTDACSGVSPHSTEILSFVIDKMTKYRFRNMTNIASDNQSLIEMCTMKNIV